MNTKHNRKEDFLRSDSEKSSYPEFVFRAVDDKRIYKKFRRSTKYRQILEHVDKNLGMKYLELISTQVNLSEIRTKLHLSQIDSVGNPYMYNYPGIGDISPSTLRYLWTLIDIEKKCGDLDDLSVYELGVGYGGQAALLQKRFKIKDYVAFDLPQVLLLAKKFLKDVQANVNLIEGNFHSNQKPDIFISNFSFSELPKELQLEYLQKVVSKSPRGYMIMNSGQTNYSNRNTGKLKLDEILAYLPWAIVEKEIPLTGPDNYLLYWRV